MMRVSWGFGVEVGEDGMTEGRMGQNQGLALLIKE
jgi:hypothetical protein